MTNRRRKNFSIHEEMKSLCVMVGGVDTLKTQYSRRSVGEGGGKGFSFADLFKSFSRCIKQISNHAMILVFCLFTF